MNFWDSSALVPLFTREQHSSTMLKLYEDCSDVMIWFLTPVEVHSAFHRLCRTGCLSSDDLDKICQHFHEAKNGFILIKDFDAVTTKARRIINTHALKAADALQLAAALVATSDSPQSHRFISLDDRLRLAAKNEGFILAPP